MPLYPYRCTQCGNRFEKIQSFTAPPETVCPKCGGALERPLTAPGLSFKGAGWYVNDYSRSGSSSSNESSSPESKGSSDGKASAENKGSGESKSASSESKSSSGDSGGSGSSSAPAAKSDSGKS